jgi:hypothetical protein
MGFSSKLAKVENGRVGAAIRADSVFATESRASGVAAQPARMMNAKTAAILIVFSCP